jgi:type IV secretion system protein VirD4
LGLLLFGAVVWATGEIGGFVSSGHRPGADFGDMGRVLVRLPRHLSDPATAWPRRIRADLPAAPLLYLLFVFVIAAVGIAALLVRKLLVVASTDRSSGSSWATARDLRSLIVKRTEPGRLILGRVGSKLVAAEQRQSVIVLGPTQSHKTSGFAIPAIVEWAGPVVATSVKTDLIHNTRKARQRRGDTWVYDPTGSTRLSPARWSPLALSTDWHGAQRTASWLASATRSGGGLADGDFWYQAAAKLLAPLLFAAATSQRTIADVVRWVNTQEEGEVTEALKATGVQAALDAVTASFKREGRQRSSVHTTAETVLAAYEDPAVAASAAGCDIVPSRFLDGGAHTLYVVAPSHEQRRLRPLFETLLHTVISHAFEQASSRGRPLEPSLLVVLDEAANIAPLRDLDSLASTAAGHGIQLVSVFQDLAQISDRYGERAQTVVNNHRAKIVLSGISDTQTLEYASRLLGDEEVLQSSVTRGAQGSRSTTQSVGLRSLAPANVLRGIKPGEGILVYGHFPPARLRLRPWFADKQLKSAVSAR